MDLPDTEMTRYRIHDVHGHLVDLAEPISLDELRGLNAIRHWTKAATTRTRETLAETIPPHLVSEVEALQIICGERPGVELALSTHGQLAAIDEKNPATPFGAHRQLAIVRYAGGLQDEETSVLIEIGAEEHADTLAWRLRSVAERLISIGASPSTRAMISIHRGESLLDPSLRMRVHGSQSYDPSQSYRLSQVRRFRDVEDLPSLKRPPEERILDSDPIMESEYTLDQALIEAARCVECGLCRDVCPSGVGLISYVDQLKQGDLEGAAGHLRDLNPGVDMTCQVCPAPCQELCILAHEEVPRRPVNIRAIEQALSHQEVTSHEIPATPTGFRVALVGLGPANMVAAARLAKKGHEVHVFEKRKDFGGAVSLIPTFRKHHGNAHEWVSQILMETGVTIQTGMALGQNLDFQQLQTEHDAVVLGFGAGKALGLGIEGEDLAGVTDALEVLRRFNKLAAGEAVPEPPPRLRNTIVIGGGDVAADVVRWYVREAARCAEEVRQIDQAEGRHPAIANVVWAYRRGRSEMPVSMEVLRETEDELDALKDHQAKVGVRKEEGELASGVHFHLRPLKILGENGQVSGIQFIRTQPGRKRDRSGRRRVEDIPGSEFTIPADSVVVLAIGQTPDPAALKGIPGISVDDQGMIAVDESMKAAENLYAVGDLVGGHILADAISHGRRAADSIHQQYLVQRAKIL
jgi:glutamate synthase (NADPH/NADH) small chain